MNLVIISFIQVFDQVFSLLIIAHVILSYFLDPYHPIRQTIGRLVEPLLAPIRRLLPSTGMFDFSPIILLLLVQMVSVVLINVLR